MAKKDLWNTISLTPLTGQLDTRSRPADIPPGGFRWKQNFAVTPEGKLCRQSGFERFFSDAASYTNYDFHSRGGTRKPLTFMFESTASDGTRRFFCGTQSAIYRLNQDTGEYDTLIDGVGAEGTRWHAAELQNTVMFTNNNDPVYMCDVAGATVSPVGSLLYNNNVSAAAVIVQYNGFMIVMNVVQAGVRQGARIHWGDLNIPDGFNIAPASSLAGFQDLEYGDDILNAAPLLGALYIFTRRSIWRMMPSGDSTSVFAFTKVYTEPKNQSGCLAFPNTLVSDGQDIRYMGRDGIYRYNPYIPAPVRDDWLHRADGLIYRQLPTQIDGDYCLSPVAEYMPTNREIWWSWPTIGTNGINNYALVSQVELKTAGVVDHGFTALVNFRRTPASAQKCNEVQDFLGVSGEDYCIKSIGGVFYREMVTLDSSGDPTVDIPEDSAYYTVGYNSILRGMVPLGMADREKKLRRLLIDHDTSEQDVPCVVQLRIGNSFVLVDPNDTDVICAPQWRVIKFDGVNGITNPPLQCADQMKLPDMAAAGLRPNKGMAWPMLETGRFLYYELTILNADGSPAVGGDTCLQRIDFDAMAMTKP